MSRVLFSLLMIFTLCTVFAHPVRADYYMFSNEEHEITASYPDTWKMINNQKPDDMLTLSASAAEDFALCRIRARDEGRFKIYPNRYNDEIVRTQFGQDFWRQYLGEYDNSVLLRFKEDAGLGRSHASLAEASFTLPGSDTKKEAIMSVSYYNNTVYIMECSSRPEAFGARRSSFLSFLKSIDFGKVPHELPGGEYLYYNKSKPSVRVVKPDGSFTVY